MLSLGHLDTLSLREQAVAAIRAAIVLGEVEPGEIYSAPSVAAQLGVSATPVREAMLDLVNEGLMAPVRNRGFRVVEVTDQDLEEIFELRVLLEVPTVSQLAGKLSDDTVAALEKALADMDDASDARDLAAYLEADRRFHLTLLAQLNNDRLLKIVDRLREHTRLYGLPRMLEAGNLAETTAEHSRILAALRTGNASDVEQLMRQHLGHTRGIWAGLREVSESTESTA